MVPQGRITLRPAAMTIVFALALILVLQGFSANAGIATESGVRGLPPGSAITGIVYWPNGTGVDLPIPVTLTNTNTGQTATAYVGDNPMGKYELMSSSGFTLNVGDLIHVNTTHENLWAQNSTVVVDDNPASFCDLRLTEFLAMEPMTAAGGGVMTALDGSFSLEVPEDSMVLGGEPYDGLLFAEASGSPLPGSFASMSMGPSGLNFDSPAMLAWSYEGLDIGGLDPENLALYTNSGGGWERQSCFVDTENDTIIAEVSHFSDFSVGPAQVTGFQTDVEIANPGATDVPIIGLSIFNPDADDTLDFVHVFSNCTDDGDVAGISLWADTDNDGVPDILIASHDTFSGDANFTGIGWVIPTDETLVLLVALNVSEDAVLFNYLDLYVPELGIGLASSGLSTEAIDPQGNVTIMHELTEPHLIYGEVSNILGTLPHAWVNVTNNRTGETKNIMADEEGAYYAHIGLMPGGYMHGDEIFVVANDTLGQTGWNVTYVDVGGPWNRCDVFIGVGPIAHDETPADGSVIADMHQNITVNITSSPPPVNETTIILGVETSPGVMVNYTIGDAFLTFSEDTLTFDTEGAGIAWADGQFVNVTLWQANDTVGNPCQNAPYEWWFTVSLGVVEDAPDIRVHKQEPDINITWEPVANATHYNVYRSLEVDGTGFDFLMMPLGSTADAFFIDAGALADANNYSYIVVGEAHTGEGPRSNIGWKYRQLLVHNPVGTSINWISQPYNTDVTDAISLINDLGGASVVDYVSRWYPATQQYIDRSPVIGPNFAITPGEGILVSVLSSFHYTMVGSYNSSVLMDLVHNPVGTSINWIALPFHSNLSQAMDLIDDLGGASVVDYVSRWDPVTQQYIDRSPVIGPNFAIAPGEAILVSMLMNLNDYDMGPVIEP